MNVTPIEIQVALEHYKDLLRQADRQRLLAEAGIHTGPELGARLHELAKNTVCRASWFSQTRVCTLNAPLA